MVLITSLQGLPYSLLKWAAAIPCVYETKISLDLSPPPMEFESHPADIDPSDDSLMLIQGSSSRDAMAKGLVDKALPFNSAQGGEYHVPRVPFWMLYLRPDPATDTYPQFRPPIQDLPNEILAHIFCVMLPAILDAPSRHTLTNVRLTCSHWNTLTLATPSLWRGIYIDECDLPLGEPSKFTSNLEGSLGVWLRRAGDKVPCTMHIGRNSFTFSSWDKGALARFIVSPRRCWEELSIPTDPLFLAEIKGHLQDGGRTGWESLKRLELYQWPSSFYDTPCLPMLQSLHLDRAVLEDAQTHGILQHSPTGNFIHPSLTSLHISCSFVDKSLTFAKLINHTSFPHLQVLILDFLLPEWSGDGHPDSMLCKHEGVEHLTVIGPGTAAVLLNLHLPSLRVWRVEKAGSREYHSLSQTAERAGWFQRFAERSGRDLHTLDLGDSQMPPADVAALLEKTPHIKKLYVQDSLFFQYLSDPMVAIGEIDEIVSGHLLAPVAQLAHIAGPLQSVVDSLPESNIKIGTRLPRRIVMREAGEGALPPHSPWYLKGAASRDI